MPPKAFKPPRASTSKKNSKSKSDVSRKSREPIRSKPSKPSTSKSKSRVSISIDSDSDPFASSTEEMEIDRSRQENNESEAEAEDIEVEEPRREYIPQELLTKLMHECFKEKDTRLRKEANVAVGRYMETFVREALARAAFMRAEIDGGRGDGFLEVEDLEKLAPQLLLDF